MTPNLTSPILPPAAAAAKLLALIAAGAKAVDINAAKAELGLALALAPGGSLGGWGSLGWK